MFIVLRARTVFTCSTLVLALFTGLFLLWSFLNAPIPPPRIGLSARSDSLARELFQSNELGSITLDKVPNLIEQLNDGGLDYLLEIDKPSPNLTSWPIGELTAVVIVPFFDLVQEMSMERLVQIMTERPTDIVFSDVLAVTTFPWSDREVQYAPSSEVIELVRKGEVRFAVIPLHHRRPSVRVLPLDGIDPRQHQEVDYPLTRTLYLSRSEKNLFSRLRDRYRLYQGKEPDSLRLAPLATPYTDPYGKQISLVAVGDVMLDRDVKKEALKRGWEYPFVETAPFLRSADIAFANLESPIGDKGRFINMFQAPPEAVEGLAFAGFDVVSLANNHALDYHIDGMLETMRLLREYGIAYIGAGRDIQEARSPLIMEVKGVKVGFLSYTEIWFVHAREPISWRATATEPGVAPAELDSIVEDIAKLRDKVDVVIVTVHWGKEYVNEPTAEQRLLAHAAVDAGAHLVLGHHPHVLQGIEFYKDGVIAYSLGNFVFDINLAKTWETMLLSFSLASTGVLDLTVVPAYIFGVQPKILQGTHRDSVYRQIRHFSLQLKKN